MRKCYAFFAAPVVFDALVWRREFRVHLLALLIAASLIGSAGAQAQAQNGPASDALPGRLSLFAHADTVPLDSGGELDGDALLERVQLIVWDRQRIAKPAAEGALGAASAELLFGIISGGSGAGQDLTDSGE